jgi:hypothetical protein
MHGRAIGTRMTHVFREFTSIPPDPPPNFGGATDRTFYD